jgi:putative molybdopterin biosynthesis protein
MEGKLLTAQEVADILKIKKNTVYELVKRGELPSKKVGKQVRISERVVAQYLNMASPQDMGAPQPAETDQDHQIILCGQDLSLDLIANHIRSFHDLPDILRSHAGSYNSLYSLYQGAAHIGTSHLWDERSKEYNYTYISKLIPGIPLVVIRLFGRMQGYYVKKGNPKNILSWEDLRRGDIRIAVREKGSGTRVLLDEKLKALSIDRNSIPGYDRNTPPICSSRGQWPGETAISGSAASAVAGSLTTSTLFPCKRSGTTWSSLRKTRAEKFFERSRTMSVPRNSARADRHGRL